MGTSNNNLPYISQPVRIDNWVTQIAGKITTGTTSVSFTFAPLTGVQISCFKITNKGNYGAYLGWGVGSATAIASSALGTGTSSCDYIASGAVIVQGFQSANGIVDTLAAIQGTDAQDNASTILEISYGFGG